MPDCNETLHEMYLYLDGELSPEVKASIQGHLDGCLDCLGAFEFHYELRSLIARKCTEDVPSGLRDRIIQCFGEFDDADEVTDGSGTVFGEAAAPE